MPTIDPLIFLARQIAGHYRYAFTLGEEAREGSRLKSNMAFDQKSIFMVTRITCLCPETVSVQILEGNELIHVITEGKEYASDIKAIRIKRLDALQALVTKVAKNAPIQIRLEGDLFPAGTLV